MECAASFTQLQIILCGGGNEYYKSTIAYCVSALPSGHWSYSICLAFCPCLPVGGVDLILGKYLARVKSFPMLEVVETPVANSDQPVPSAANSVFPACVVTRKFKM